MFDVQIVQKLKKCMTKSEKTIPLRLVKTFLCNKMSDSRTSDVGVLYINKQR
uniref:Uncharacterized protein n=1 Tax=Romanomermis culicivorax TaxID=13658 RepID=A0A915IV81_ROMCU